VLDNGSSYVEIVCVHILDLAAIAKGCECRIKRDLAKNIIAEALRDLKNMAFSVDIDALSAIGANCIAHVLNKTENRNVHHIRHISRLADDHGNELLGARYDHDTVKRKALENGERYVTGAGRAVNKKNVNVAPNSILPELLYGTRDNRTSPDNGSGFLFKKKVYGHHFDTLLCGGREHSVLASGYLTLDSKSLGNGRTGDIGIKYAYAVALALKKNGEHTGNKRFTNAALAADNTDYVLDITLGICGLVKILRCLARCAVRRAGGTVVCAF
jgi:hypothetical protein